MAGFTPNEGENYIARVLYGGETRTSLTAGLFTNNTQFTDTVVWANITQPTGGNYAEIALTDGSFDTTSGTGVTTYPLLTWTATGSDFSAPIYGYYIRNTEGTPKILHIEANPGGAKTVLENDSYTVDLTTDTE